MKITESHIIELFDEKYAQLGRHYCNNGMLELTSISSKDVTAKCIGNRIYNVSLHLKDDFLAGECTCPAFENFGPCKHMAATAYAVIKNHNKSYKPSEEYNHRKEQVEQIEQYFQQKSKSELISFIMQLMQDDSGLQWMIEQEIEEEMLLD